MIAKTAVRENMCRPRAMLQQQSVFFAWLANTRELGALTPTLVSLVRQASMRSNQALQCVHRVKPASSRRPRVPPFVVIVAAVHSQLPVPNDVLNVRLVNFQAPTPSSAWTVWQESIQTYRVQSKQIACPAVSMLIHRLGALM